MSERDERDGFVQTDTTGPDSHHGDVDEGAALDALFEELEKDVPAYALPAKGDITKRMVAKRNRCSLQAADERMNKAVATGKWKLVMVKGGYGDKPHNVLRKVV